MPSNRTRAKDATKAKKKSPASSSGTKGVGELRAELGLTQQEFATLLGLSTVSVSRWEHKHTRPTDASEALLGLLDRARRKRPTGEIVDRLRTLAGASELDRIVALVHLGD